MAQQTINIGTVANDGTGDPLRTAFDKSNDNFTDLYAGAGVADNSITSAKLGTEYKTNVILTSGENDLDFSTAQIFTKTISGSTTLTISNAVAGDIKLCYMAGDAPTFPAGSVVGGGEWEVGTTNVVQIAYTGYSYLYAINQLN